MMQLVLLRLGLRNCQTETYTWRSIAACFSLRLCLFLLSVLRRLTHSCPPVWRCVRCLSFLQGGSVCRLGDGKQVQALHPGSQQQRAFITRPNNFR